MFRKIWVRSFSNLSITSPTLQLILQPFRRFTYVTAHSPILPLLHLCYSLFSNPSFASPTSYALHLIHLASRPCLNFMTRLYFVKNELACMHSKQDYIEKKIKNILLSSSNKGLSFLNGKKSFDFVFLFLREK